MNKDIIKIYNYSKEKIKNIKRYNIDGMFNYSFDMGEITAFEDIIEFIEKEFNNGKLYD